MPLPCTLIYRTDIDGILPNLQTERNSLKNRTFIWAAKKSPRLFKFKSKQTLKTSPQYPSSRHSTGGTEQGRGVFFCFTSSHVYFWTYSGGGRGAGFWIWKSKCSGIWIWYEELRLQIAIDYLFLAIVLLNLKPTSKHRTHP